MTVAIKGISADDIRSGEVSFVKKWRGYDPAQVDPLIRAAEKAAFSHDIAERKAMAKKLRDAEFRAIRRGYDRMSVDLYMQLLIEEYLLPSSVE